MVQLAELGEERRELWRVDDGDTLGTPDQAAARGWTFSTSAGTRGMGAGYDAAAARDSWARIAKSFRAHH